MKYYVNRDTGQLLDELQMRKQLETQYTEVKDWQDQYEEVVLIQLFEEEDGSE